MSCCQMYSESASRRKSEYTFILHDYFSSPQGLSPEDPAHANAFTPCHLFALLITGNIGFNSPTLHTCAGSSIERPLRGRKKTVMPNLFRHLTCKVYDLQFACPVGCRNKFGMTDQIRINNRVPINIKNAKKPLFSRMAFNI